MGKNGSILALVLLILGLVVYFWESPETILGARGNSTETFSAQPYAIVNNAFSRYYNDQGILDYTFKASTLKYFRNKNSEQNSDAIENFTEIEEPRLLIFHEGQPWLLKAEHGKFTEQNRHLLLWDKVVVSHALEDEKYTTLTTEKLEIKPEEKYAYTQEPVNIESAAGKISAIGMIANFAEKQITLLSEVRGSHDPIL